MATLLEVLHEDDRLVALNKPAGLLVHRSSLDAHETDTLLERAEAQFGQRLFPAHRLDKGTSGLLLLARDASTASQLGEAFRAGQVEKRYLALVRGWPREGEGLIDHPLARDPERPSQAQTLLPAQTRFRVLRRFERPFATQPGFANTRIALLELEPLQGRRHQIRRHCKHIAHPLLGDATHGKGPLNRAWAAQVGLQRLWLHAASLRLPGQAWLHAPPGAEWAPFYAG
jgi:tRNA pseudouridine65 synthase